MPSKQVKIFSTKDYKKFKTIKKNRDVNANLVTKLMKSIGQRNLMEDRPILVDRKMNVIDGQNRLKACEAINEIVWYRYANVATENDVATIQLSKNWGAEDYMKMYVKSGNKHYRKFKSFMQEFEIPRINFALFVLKADSVGTRTIRSGNGFGVSSSFKSGDFVYPDDDSGAREFMKKINRAMRYCNPSSRCDLSKKAIIIMMRDERYDHKRMMKKLKEFGGGMYRVPNIVDYISQFEKIYNHSISRRNYVKF